MPTLDELEISTEDSRPVELYAFTLGSTSYLFSNQEDTITVGPDVYLPESLKRDATVQSNSSQSRVLNIRIPTENAFASFFTRRPPGVQAMVSIFGVQRDETPSIGTTMIVEFRGYVRGAEFPGSGREAVLGCLSAESALDESMPRYTYQGLCGHYLFDPLCGIDPLLHRLQGAISAESGRVITVPGIGAFSAKFGAGGYVKPDLLEDFRMIVTQSGDDLTLNAPFVDSALGLDVDCFKGCDRKIDGDCQLEYDNVIEFGGHQAVPKLNVFQNGLR